MKFYTCANTSCGFCNFTSDNVFDIENVIELKGSDKYIVDAVLRCYCNESSQQFDKIIAPGTENLKSGIISKNRKLAVVSDFADGKKIVDIDEILKLKSIPQDSHTIPKDMEDAYKEAKKIHDDWEKIYINNMDFSRLDLFCKDMISYLVKSKSKYGSGKVYKRFFGTTTPNGPINFIDNLTLRLPTRYFIKGRPGTGKSTFLKKLSSALLDCGFDIEQYYCSFDPYSLDMVVSRELNFCVFDSTHPHEKFPERENDIILDFYEESGLDGVDEKYARELYEIKNAYNSKIKQGNVAFKNAMSVQMNKNTKGFENLKDKDILCIVDVLKNIQ